MSVKKRDDFLRRWFLPGFSERLDGIPGGRVILAHSFYTRTREFACVAIPQRLNRRMVRRAVGSLQGRTPEFLDHRCQRCPFPQNLDRFCSHAVIEIIL